MRAVLRHRSFRYLFASQLISQVGDRLTLVVLALAVTDLTGSAADVGLVLAARFVPLVVLVPFGGVWADRLARRTVMLVADLARLVLHALLAALFFAGVVEVWHVVAIEVAFGAAEAFATPAHQGLIPQTVPEEEIQEATALTALSRNVAMLAGPAIGTAIFAAAGAGWAFAVDAASFAVGAALLLAVQPRARGRPPQRTAFLGELADGLREVRARTWLWLTVLAANTFLLLADGPFIVLGPLHAGAEYGDPEVYGLFVTAMGAGLVGGALLGTRLKPDRPLLLAYPSLALLGVGYVAFGCAAPPAVLLPLAVLGGAGASLFDVLWFSALAREVPPEALSRVSSFDFMGSYASIPVAFLLAAPAAGALGREAVLVLGAAVAALAVLLATAVPAVRSLSVSGSGPAAASPSSGARPGPTAPGPPR